jgi:hypothetical protein
MLIHNTQTSAESTETDFRHLSFIQPILIPRLVNLSRITACREHFALQTIYRGGGAWPLLGFRIVFKQGVTHCGESVLVEVIEVLTLLGGDDATHEVTFFDCDVFADGFYLEVD